MPTKIPKNPITIENWKKIPIQPTEESLVPLGIFASYPQNLVHTDGIYAGEMNTSPYKNGLKGSLLASFVRKNIAEKLEKARQYLPEDMTFVIWDSFRPLKVQQALFDWFSKQLEKKNPEWQEKKILIEAQKFVALPSTDPSCPSPHNTGGAVDLGIIRIKPDVWKKLKAKAKQVKNKHWKEIYRFEMEKAKIFRQAEILPMGTVFDEVSKKTATNFFEYHPTLSEKCLENRRLLYFAMIKAGFMNYEEEWWHYSFGDQFWAKKVDSMAIYGSAKLSTENLWWEKDVRKGHYQRNLGWQKNKSIQFGKFGMSDALKFSHSIAELGFGELSFSLQPRAEMI